MISSANSSGIIFWQIKTVFMMAISFSILCIRQDVEIDVHFSVLSDLLSGLHDAIAVTKQIIEIR